MPREKEDEEMVDPLCNRKRKSEEERRLLKAEKPRGLISEGGPIRNV